MYSIVLFCEVCQFYNKLGSIEICECQWHLFVISAQRDERRILHSCFFAQKRGGFFGALLAATGRRQSDRLTGRPQGGRRTAPGTAVGAGSRGMYLESVYRAAWSSFSAMTSTSSPEVTKSMTLGRERERRKSAV